MKKGFLVCVWEEFYSLQLFTASTVRGRASKQSQQGQCLSRKWVRQRLAPAIGLLACICTHKVTLWCDEGLQSRLALMPERNSRSLITQEQATHPVNGTVVWAGQQWIDFLFIKYILCPDYHFFTYGFKVSWLYGVLTLPRKWIFTPRLAMILFNLLCQILLPFSLAALWGSIRTDGWGVRSDNHPFLRKL